MRLRPPPTNSTYPKVKPADSAGFDFKAALVMIERGRRPQRGVEGGRFPLAGLGGAQGLVFALNSTGQA